MPQYADNKDKKGYKVEEQWTSQYTKEVDFQEGTLQVTLNKGEKLRRTVNIKYLKAYRVQFPPQQTTQLLLQQPYSSSQHSAETAQH